MFRKSRAHWAASKGLPWVLCMEQLYQFAPFYFWCSVTFAFLHIAASHELQPMDAPLLHLLPADRGLLRPQHVCGGGGREFPQVSAAPGGGRSQEAGGEEASPAGEKEKE